LQASKTYPAVTVSYGIVNRNAAFTPDTCSPDTSCSHLYPLSPSTCILYRRQNCRHGDMYPLVSASRTLLTTCIRLHVSGVNEALACRTVSASSLDLRTEIYEKSQQKRYRCANHAAPHEYRKNTAEIEHIILEIGDVRCTYT